MAAVRGQDHAAYVVLRIETTTRLLQDSGRFPYLPIGRRCDCPVSNPRGSWQNCLRVAGFGHSRQHIIQCPAVVGRTLRVMSWFGLALARQTAFVTRQNFPINKLRNDAACDRHDYHLLQRDMGFCLDLIWFCNHTHTMESSSCLFVFTIRSRCTGNLYGCAREHFRNMQPVT